MKRTTLSSSMLALGGFAISLGWAACSQTAELRPTEDHAGGESVVAPVGIPSAQIGLVKGDLHEVPTPPAVVVDAKDPGEATPIPRAFPSSPPPIPHNLDDIEPIARTGNACLDCHDTSGQRVAGEPTPLPPSHLSDLRDAPDTVGDEVSGARWLCLACHVPQTKAPELVGNRFAP